MMRVVVDTNVFVSSFFGGNPRKIIDLWKSADITLCLTGAIILEVSSTSQEAIRGGPIIKKYIINYK